MVPVDLTVMHLVAVLPGSNAQLKDQAAMFSAHYDHLGIVPGMGGDNTFTLQVPLIETVIASSSPWG